MTHYTNPHTFKQYSRVCIEKSIKLRLSYAFADFRNIAQRAKLCKTVQNVPNSFYNFKWKTRGYLWIVEIWCWIFLTNFIPKYQCAVGPTEAQVWVTSVKTLKRRRKNTFEQLIVSWLLPRPCIGLKILSQSDTVFPCYRGKIL